MTKRLGAALAVMLLTSLGAAQALELPQPGAVDARIQTIPYDPNQVVLLRGTLGYQVMLEFDPSEKIETVSIGDALGWQVTPNRRADVLFLKPLSRSVTNLTVLTNLRRYAFELRVVPKSANEPVLYVARMTYPPPAQAIPVPPEPEAPPVVANNAYSMSGATTDRPVKIFDDGHKTYFQWRPDQALPAIFAVSKEGAESLVNYVIRGAYVVVDQVAAAFVLRDGKEVTKVINNGPVGAAR